MYTSASPRPWDASRVSDHLQIQQLMYKFCSAVDKLDLEALRSVYHPDAYDNHGPFKGQVDSFIEWVQKRHSRGITFSSHMIGNMLIEFSSDTHALVESYVRTVQQYDEHAAASLNELFPGQSVAPAEGAILFSSSRYVDRVERRDSGWKILSRQVVAGWKGVAPAQAGVAAPGWEYGTRDRNDFFLRELRALGLNE